MANRLTHDVRPAPQVSGTTGLFHLHDAPLVRFEPGFAWGVVHDGRIPVRIVCAQHVAASAGVGEDDAEVAACQHARLR